MPKLDENMADGEIADVRDMVNEGKRALYETGCELFAGFVDNNTEADVLGKMKSHPLVAARSLYVAGFLAGVKLREAMQ